MVMHMPLPQQQLQLLSQLQACRVMALRLCPALLRPASRRAQVTATGGGGGGSKIDAVLTMRRARLASEADAHAHAQDAEQQRPHRREESLAAGPEEQEEEEEEEYLSDGEVMRAVARLQFAGVRFNQSVGNFSGSPADNLNAAAQAEAEAEV